MGAAISAAGYAPDALTPLREWSLRQVDRMASMAARERWRHRTWREALKGMKPGQEPDWGLDPKTAKPTRAPITKAHEDDFEAMKARYEAQPGRFDPDGRKFPGML